MGLYVQRRGRGRPVVVLHGGLGLDHSYLRSLDALEDMVELVYVDLPGNGRSPAPERWSDVTIESIADELDALRHELGFERWTVLGHSFGACTALVYATRYARRLDGLIPIGGCARFDHAPRAFAAIHERGQPEAAAALLAAFSQPVMTDEELAGGYRAVMPLYFHRWDPDFERAFADVVYSAAAFARGTSLLASYDVAHRLRDIAAPALVIAGDDDFVMPASVSALVAASIPGSTLAVLEACGHYPFIEQPAAFLRSVRAWLRAQD